MKYPSPLSTLRKRRAEILRASKLYAILDTGYTAPAELPRMAELLFAGGVRVFQLRAKTYSPGEIECMAHSLMEVFRGTDALFLINDHPALAAKIGADGAHVGQDDEAVAQARALLGPDALLGKSTHSIAQARAAQDEDLDYIGFGPIFATPTKPDYTPIGTAEIAEVVSFSRVPVFCIGGLKRQNLRALLEAGMRYAVIVSGLLTAHDPRAEAAACLEILGAPSPKASNHVLSETAPGE